MAGREADDADQIAKLREAARRRWGNADDDVDAIASKLDSESAEERAKAAWALAELAADRDADADTDISWRLPVESKLAPLLHDDDPWVRRGASWAVATVAEAHPQRAQAAFPAVIDGLGDEDPLVRENSVLALSGVAREYPHAAESAMSQLADLVHDEDGLARRYAAEALRKLVRELDGDGFPETVEATPEVAALLPGDVSVVEVNEDPANGRPIQIGSRAERTAGASEDGTGRGSELGPPDRISEPSAVAADFGDFVRLEDLGKDPLTAAVKARAPSSAEGSQHVVVSVRILRSDVTISPGRVERAIRAWAGVDDHDHIAPILARGPAPRPWFATEFFDGGTLRDQIGSVGFDRALWYAHCLVKATCYAHARGVVHGALRPAAIGFSKSLGAWAVPKVGVWGFGDLLADARAQGRGSTGPVFPVPPAYAAPEHVAPEQFGRPDHATDVYQLGTLCYALFTGRPPFVGDAASVVENVRSVDPAPASEFTPGLPAGVDDLLDRALTKDKPARFETVEDFRRALELVLEDRDPSWWPE